MSKKNKKNKPEIFLIDTNITYSIPMLKNGIRQYIDNEKITFGVRAKQDSKHGGITFYKEGYQSKYIVDKYAEWLLYTGYIKKESDGK